MSTNAKYHMLKGICAKSYQSQHALLGMKTRRQEATTACLSYVLQKNNKGLQQTVHEVNRPAVTCSTVT